MPFFWSVALPAGVSIFHPPVHDDTRMNSFGHRLIPFVKDPVLQPYLEGSRGTRPKRSTSKAGGGGTYVHVRTSTASVLGHISPLVRRARYLPCEVCRPMTRGAMLGVQLERDTAPWPSSAAKSWRYMSVFIY